MLTEHIKWDKDGLVVTVVQDAETNRVLMVAYMSNEALDATLRTGNVHFWSRSRQKLWMKGETSGNILKGQEIRIDCDGDALLVKAKQTGPACHTGNVSCFYRAAKEKAQWEQISDDSTDEKSLDGSVDILRQLYDVIVERNAHPKEGSYTNSLFTKGIDVILKKVGEESSEVIIAAKNRNKDEVIYEVCDLVYHVMVMLVEQGVALEDIYHHLRERR